GAGPLDPDFARPLGVFVDLHASSGWGYDDSAHAKVFHPGIDFPIDTGTPVHAMADGFVIHVDSDGGGDAGKYIAIQHPSGWISRYLHLSKTLVERGLFVPQGQVIGKSGSTGNSQIPHLHVDLWLKKADLAWLDGEIGHPTTGYPVKLSMLDETYYA